MSFNSVEQSNYLSKLVEYYRFDLNGDVYRFNNSPIAKTLSGGTDDQNGEYDPETISTSEPEHSRESKGTRLQITVPRDNAIAQLYRLYPPETSLLVQVFRKHESDAEITTWWRGSIRNVDFRGSVALLDCNPTLARNDGLGLWAKWQMQCNLPTYGTRCGVDRNDFKQSLTIEAIDGNEITVSTHGKDDGWYTGGYVETADGSRRHIRLHEGETFTLILNFEELAVDDVVDCFAGDDHTHETCRTKFFAAGDEGNPDGNIANFLGFFTTPGRNPWTQGGLTRAGATGFASAE